jgi:hypothetical protein
LGVISIRKREVCYGSHNQYRGLYGRNYLFGDELAGFAETEKITISSNLEREKTFPCALMLSKIFKNFYCSFIIIQTPYSNDVGRLSCLNNLTTEVIIEYI